MDTRLIGKIAGSSDQGFLDAVCAVLDETAHLPDEKCLELSRELEKFYVVTHLQSARYNVELIRNGLQTLSLSSSDPGRIVLLDIGTSPLTFLYKLCLDITVCTIDLTRLLAERCDKHGIIHKQCDLLRDSFPFESGTFDVCVFTEVMEHLPVGPGRVFSEIRRVLKTEGSLVFSVPNAAALKKRLKAFFGYSVLDPVYEVFKEDKSIQSHGDGGWVHGLGHVREYTMAEAEDIIKHYRFEKVSSVCINPSRTVHRGLSARRRIIHGLREMAQRIMPNSRGINAILCRKVGNDLADTKVSHSAY